jgi:3-methylornithine--L-lysine ligase
LKKFDLNEEQTFMSALNNKIVIIGGKLQGTEACYLAQKAGIETVLVDKNPQAPARHLCTTFICEDLFERSNRLLVEMKEADMVLPALENDVVLRWLDNDAKEQRYTLAFDWPAYQISSSKLKSDMLFRQCGIPVPEYFPGGAYPYICKPDRDSGSHGVERLNNAEELHAALDKKSDLVIQEFLEGPSYSIEIIGKPGMYRTYLPTQIHMDQMYDCKMVTAPCGLTSVQEETLRKLAFTIADEIKLHGIMDLEVIDHHGTFKVLEIDARIPSQTPTAVLHSSGMNLLEELRDIYATGYFLKNQERRGYYVAYEHYLFAKNIPYPLGERIMTQGKPLHHKPGFCGADDVLTDCQPGLDQWRGTFVNAAPSKAALMSKRARMLGNFAKR